MGPIRGLARRYTLASQVRYEDILAAPSEDWLTFMGDYSANRHSPLREIDKSNVATSSPSGSITCLGRPP